MKIKTLFIFIFISVQLPLFSKVDSIICNVYDTITDKNSFADSIKLCEDSNSNECFKLLGKVKSYVHGKASFYAGKFIGRKTANGEIFTSLDYTCAHMTYKFGTMLRVTNIKNGKSVIVRVNDRGAFHKYGRSIDLSKAAFKRIASTKSGVIKVKIEKIGKA